MLVLVLDLYVYHRYHSYYCMGIEDITTHYMSALKLHVLLTWH